MITEITDAKIRAGSTFLSNKSCFRLKKIVQGRAGEKNACPTLGSPDVRLRGYRAG